jgi:hypothetical protein
MKSIPEHSNLKSHEDGIEIPPDANLEVQTHRAIPAHECNHAYLLEGNLLEFPHHPPPKLEHN